MCRRTLDHLCPSAGLGTLDAYTHRLLSGSFLGFPRILNINHKKELLRSLWVVTVTSN